MNGCLENKLRRVTLQNNSLNKSANIFLGEWNQKSHDTKISEKKVESLVIRINESNYKMNHWTKSEWILNGIIEIHDKMNECAN